MALSLTAKLKKAQEVFEAAKKRAKEEPAFVEIDDGRYKAKLIGATLGTSKASGRAQVTWVWKIIEEGDFKGQRKYVHDGVETEDNLTFFLRTMALLGVDGDDVDLEENALKKTLKKLVAEEIVARINLITSGEFQNCRIVKVLEDEDDDADDDGDDDDDDDDEEEKKGKKSEEDDDDNDDDDDDDDADEEKGKDDDDDDKEKYEASEILEMNSIDLQAVIDGCKLKVDLSGLKKSEKRQAVIKALTKKGLIKDGEVDEDKDEDADDDDEDESKKEKKGKKSEEDDDDDDEEKGKDKDSDEKVPEVGDVIFFKAGKKEIKGKIKKENSKKEIFTVRRLDTKAMVEIPFDAVTGIV